MKAATFRQYGSTANLRVEEHPTPVPSANQVLVRIKCAAVNDYDWSMVTGKPALYRIMFGLLKPKQIIPGMELSGIVESVGENVSRFTKGQAVYGDISDYGFGSYAEYIAVDEKALRLKPEFLSFEQAAAVSHAAMLAYQALIDYADIQPNEKVLINGAGGGVGDFGLALAKSFGAHVTGVDAEHKIQNMLDAGFDEALDYRAVDYTATGQKYDLILDTKSCRSPFAIARCLNTNGRYVTVGGQLSKMLIILLAAPLLKRRRKLRFQIVSLKTNKNLAAIERLMQKGGMRPRVEGPFALAEAHRALEAFGTAKHNGKVIINTT